MTTITAEIAIDAPIAQVWALIADFPNIAIWNPDVTESYATSRQTSGTGATRHCDLKPMGSLEERVVDWQEGQMYQIIIEQSDKTPPFKTASGRLSVREEGNQTRATMTIEYTLKYGVIGNLLDVLIVRTQLTKALPRVVVGLKHYAETGAKLTRAHFTAATAIPTVQVLG